MTRLGPCCVPLLSLLLGVDVSLGYNVEVSVERTFSSGNSSSFGYRVGQVNTSGGERVLVGDPGSGMLHTCDVISGKCEIVMLPNMSSTIHLGLTLEVEPVSGQGIVCGTDLPHDCKNTLYMNGACYTLDSSLSPSQKLIPGYQDCEKAAVDLCFLFDGSSSMGEFELNGVKKFLKSALQRLKNTTVHFAVVQFSHLIRKEFDFNQYQQLQNLTEIIQNMTVITGATSTYSAINYTLNEIFTKEGGARPNAKKVLLLLTDGEAGDKTDVIIERAEQERVKRYIIGVGNNFGTPEGEKTIEHLASKPTVNHTQVLIDFSALETLFEELQHKILAIEGVDQGSSFSRELSSAGLSAALLQDRRVVGDPGIFDWSGGILDLSKKEIVNMTHREEYKYGYMGYSVRLLRTREGIFFVAGAPRYQYIGLVTVLREIPEEPGWEEIAFVKGEQVGSYFGSEITVSDLNQDGHSDLVLISAPHHYEVKWSGQVFVCLFKKRLLGPPGGRGFGLSIHGVLDMTQDGLTDVVVGSWGHVTLHRSQPLLRVSVNVTVSPENIPIPSMEAIGCESEVTLQACVHSEILTPKYTGPLNVSLQYTLILDTHRTVSRMVFANNQKQIDTTVTVRSQGRDCQNHTVLLQDCSLEDVSHVQVSFTLSPVQNVSQWLLSPSSNLNHTTEIPFQICGSGGSCEPDIHVHLQHTQLVVRDGASFSVFLRLQNIGEGAHRVKLRVTYPAGLFFRKSNITQTSRQISLGCGEFTAQILTCNVSHPILRRAVWVDIQVMFGIVPNVSWADRALLAVNVTSDNDGNQTSTTNKVLQDVPVLYPINVITRSLENSTKYTQFSKQEEKSFISHGYQIQNLGSITVPTQFTLSMMTPAALPGGLVWDFRMTHEGSGGSCVAGDHSGGSQGYSEGRKRATNKTWQCTLDNLGAMNIRVDGLLKPSHSWRVETTVSVRSEVMIQYNESRYHSDMGHTFHTAQVVTQVELLVPPNHILYIVGSSVGGVVLLVVLIGLLYKCGFFKRYKDRMAEKESCKSQADGEETTGVTEEKVVMEPLSAESP